MNITIAKNDQKIGPFDETQVADMLKSGMLATSDLGWAEGMNEWKPLSSFGQFQSSTTEPPPVPVTTHSFGSPSIPKIDPSVSFEKDPNLVYPVNPPRSTGWMTFWGFIWPGLGQVLCGQGAKGGVLMVASFFLCLILSVTVILPLGICIAGAIDANKVAKALASGRPVGKWQFFPE